jgi:hypothetical protein
LKGKDESVYF